MLQTLSSIAAIERRSLLCKAFWKRSITETYAPVKNHPSPVRTPKKTRPLTMISPAIGAIAQRKRKGIVCSLCTGQPEAMRALLLRIFFRRLPSLRPDDAGGHAGRSHTDLAARLKEKQGCCERRKATVCNSPFLGRLCVSFPSLQGGTFCPGFVKFSFFK